MLKNPESTQLEYQDLLNMIAITEKNILEEVEPKKINELLDLKKVLEADKESIEIDLNIYLNYVKRLNKIKSFFNETNDIYKTWSLLNKDFDLMEYDIEFYNQIKNLIIDKNKN